ncbi:hypothetical protein OH77DRAFT_1522066 [Trametes cingulata]|nr:hypothetical protein OH77DRAFT_1522066 [Trametes cingulata]
MGKLNIAHHKSYHPYRRDNIERVRRDEEEARRKEAAEEGRMMLADSEARIDLLRQRAGLGGSKGKGKGRGDEEDLDKLLERQSQGAGPSTEVAAVQPVSTLTTAKGHINFFEDLEKSVIPVHGSVMSTKKPPPGGSESEKGVALAPSAKDLKPWYVDAGRGEDEKEVDEKEEIKRRRDLQRKSAHDPLTAINSQLASRSSGNGTPSSSSSYSSARRPRALPPPATSSAPPEVAARLTRESAERQRALELIARKKREMAGSETPSTVYGGSAGDRRGMGGGGYGDVFNRREVDEVQRERRRGWERDRDRDRDRDGARRYGGRW